MPLDEVDGNTRMNELVEQIVREVMSRLAADDPASAGASSAAGSTDARSAAGAAAACQDSIQEEASTATDAAGGRRELVEGNRTGAALSLRSAVGAAARPSDQLFLPGKVVALADLADQLDRVRCVSVAAGAVVTPALRDELQRRGIALRFVSKNRSDPTAQENAEAELRIRVIVHQGCIDERPLQTLRLEGASIAVSSSECVIEACDEAARAVVGNEALAVVMTRYAAAAICLANRIPQVRAVSARDAAELKAAMTMVGANVVVIDPGGVGAYGVRRLLREAAIVGCRKCPRAFGARLN